MKSLALFLLFISLYTLCAESATLTYFKATMQNGKTQQVVNDYDTINCPDVQGLKGNGNTCMDLVYRSPITKLEFWYMSGYMWAVNITNDGETEFGQ